MRTLIIFPILLFVGFGFLLSDSFYTHQDLSQSRDQNNSLMEENKQLRNQVDVVNARVAENENKISDLTQKNMEQADNITQLSGENSNLHNQIYYLQAKAQILQRALSVRDASSNAMRLAVFLPFIPGSMMVTYIFVRSKTKLQRKDTNNQHTTWVQLTEQEIQAIIRMRRHR
jgi:hypothetical protein